ncbi:MULTISPECIES: aromatic acid exporter family protein [unclassified Virgibacillus]|uniref:FUSC family protein n=1 Tax=unclassified Virgibacillus TaxID=2620237 RepID=UPI0024DDFCA0|nr:aromatic acid exporter family protein [Virgibacillus sp. LDC-1]
MRFRFAGGRVVKTGVAVFLTAWICQLLNWPPVFAVITAIVTLEPTVSDSIKKGIIRFPASAIGSAYAVLFISLFGNSPITYTLAAVFTIATCYRLKLHAGLLVATLTAVAMIEVIHSNLFIAFFIRLATTTIGLLVSTGVNMFILPPDYTKEILERIQSIRKKTAQNIERVFSKILRMNEDNDQIVKQSLKEMNKTFQKADSFIRYQKEEATFHPLVGTEKDKFKKAQLQLSDLRLIHYHLSNLINTPMQSISWTEEERSFLLHAIDMLVASLNNPSQFDPLHHQVTLKQVTALFWEDNEEITKNNAQHPTYFPPELIILYELLAIFNAVSSYYDKNDSHQKT